MDITKLLNTLKKPKNKGIVSDTPDLTKDAIKFGLNNDEVKFVYYYVKNDGTYGNGTMSWAMSHGIDLDSYSKDDAKYKITWGKDKKGKKIELSREMIEESSYTKAEAVCASSASRSLRRVKIQDLRIKYLNDLLTDEIVDAELTKVIKQNYSPQAKVAAIKERNKIAGRHVDRLEVTGADGEQLFGHEHKSKSKSAITGFISRRNIRKRG